MRGGSHFFPDMPALIVVAVFVLGKSPYCRLSTVLNGGAVDKCSTIVGESGIVLVESGIKW